MLLRYWFSRSGNLRFVGSMKVSTPFYLKYLLGRTALSHCDGAKKTVNNPRLLIHSDSFPRAGEKPPPSGAGTVPLAGTNGRPSLSEVNDRKGRKAGSRR